MKYIECMDSIFKQTLRSEMDFQDVRVKELAAKTGISPRTLEGYLSSRGSMPPADVAVKIADALNVSVEYLVKGKTSEKKSEREQFGNLLPTDLSMGKRTLLKEFAELLEKFEVKSTK